MKKLFFLSLFLSSCWGDDGGIYYAKACLVNDTDYNLEINAFYKKKNVKSINIQPKRYKEFFVTNFSSSFLEGYDLEKVDSINIIFNKNKILVTCGGNILNASFCPDQRFDTQGLLSTMKLSYLKKHNNKKVYRNTIKLSITEADYEKAVSF